jgi:GntR family transcriptional repressor for pyruvate dehydrogenase complex
MMQAKGVNVASRVASEPEEEAPVGTIRAVPAEHFTAGWMRPAINARPRALKRSEIVAREIVEDVLSRKLHPGDVLAPESAMLAQYGVGRATLREALRLLEAQGLVILRPGPGGGTVVSEVDASDMGNTATLFFRLAGATYRELGEAQAVLQPWLAELAASRPDYRTASQELIATVDVIEGVRDDPQGVFRTGPQFHAVVARLSGNPVLSTFANAVDAIFVRQVLSHIDLSPMHPVFLDAHRKLANAIAAGRPTQARRIATQHAREVNDYCELRAPSRLDQIVEWL